MMDGQNLHAAAFRAAGVGYTFVAEDSEQRDIKGRRATRLLLLASGRPALKR